MADPLSTAASAVGPPTAAAQISKILANVIDKARHAPKDCSRIKSEVDDIRNVLVTLQLYIVGTRRAARSRTSLSMAEQVVATLAACVTKFSELNTFATALQNDADMKILDRLRWASKEKDIKAVLVRLESHKSSLTLMLTILTCQSQDDAESRVDTLCNLVGQMLLRELILKERLVALEVQLLSYVLDMLGVFASLAGSIKTAGLRLISIFQHSIISGPPSEMDAEAHRAASSVALMLLIHDEYIWGEMDA